MSLDLANLTISRIMVHVIHARDEDKRIVEPDYSDEFTSLDNKGLDTLQTRVINAIGNDSHGIEMAIAKVDGLSCFQLAARLMSMNNEQYIEKSKRLAHKLAEAQESRRIPGGAIVIMDGNVGVNGRRYLCVIKAETHEGFHNKKQNNAITMEYITNLLLTPQQKLYKIGLFVENKNTTLTNGDLSASDFSAYVFDHNMTKKETRSAAHYFYGSSSNRVG